MESLLVMSEIAAEVALETGAGIEVFLPIPKPPVRLLGAAINATGHPLASITEINASTIHYLVVVELPEELNCNRDVNWVVNDVGKITIKGRLRSYERWAISFYLPGPVDWWTTEVLFTSRNVMEITVAKSRPATEAAVDSTTTDVAQ